jgi:hypothetical protein
VSVCSIIHKDLGYHNVCARWVPKQFTNTHGHTWKHAFGFCSDVMKKERFFCNILSQVTKHMYDSELASVVS